MLLLTKLLLIGVVWLVVAQTESMMVWCFVGAPLGYLIWRVEPRRG